MCEFDAVSNCFGTLSVLLYISTFILTLLNMIFSCINPKEFNTFKYINLIDYTQPINSSFLMELNFGSELSDTDDYGSLGKIEYRCYLGECVIDFTKKVSYNCSLACLNGIDNCYYGEKLCDSKECDYYWRNDTYRACHEFNRIKIWKNTQMKKYNKTFEVNRYSHIIPNDGNCKSGYKKCGIVNDAEDYLCLKEEYDCPINSIIIKPKNELPDSDYKSYQFGDQFIFISNKKINEYIITNITITTYIDKSVNNIENIDKDYYSNVKKYNPYISSSSSIIYLNLVKFQTNFTYKDMIEFQDKYNTRAKIYNSSVIKEMNTEVKEYKSALMGFGIGAFASLAITGFYFISMFGSNDCKCNCHCSLCRNMTPMKRAILFYLVFSPCIILSFFGFIFTIIKKISYNKLVTKEYIDEYKNFGEKDDEDFLEKSILYNHMQFIVLLIIVIIIIVYPIIIKLCSYIPSFNYTKNSENQKYNKRQYNKKINTKLLKYNQTPNNLIPGQYNSNNNYPSEPYYQKPTANPNAMNYQAPPANYTPYNYQYPSY